MTDIREYKKNKIDNQIKELEKIHSSYLQEELKERNNKPMDLEKVNTLTAKLKEMRTTDSIGSAYSPESFM